MAVMATLENKWERFRRETNIDLQAELAAAGSGEGGLDNYYTKDETNDLLGAKTDVVTTEALESRVDSLESSPGVVDHGALTGLSDDDHPQYLNTTRGDARYYTKEQTNASLANKADTTTTDELDDRVTTLEGSTGPDLTNYYTKTESNNLLSGKADSSTVTAHASNTNNPHGVTKTQVGLSNVDNTSDLNKPISTAVQAALAGKSDATHNHDSRYYTESEVDTLLSAKANTSTVTALDAEVDTKAPLAHSHENLEVIEFAPNVGEISGSVGVRLTIPTHVSPAGGQTTHPSVVFIPEGLNGYKYWMAHTPYPAGNDDHEDPNIVASNDGVTWVMPAGISNPIDDADGQPEYNSDVDLRFVNGTLYLFWRWFDQNSTGSEERLYYSTSTNGVNWTPKIECYRSNMASLRMVSPSFVWEGDRWTMYAIDTVPTPNRVVRLVSTTSNPAGAWSAPATVAMGTMQSGKEPWHMQIIKHAGRYVGILNDCTIDQSGTNGDLLFVASSTGTSFSNAGPIITRSQPGEHDNMYRATLIPSVEKGVLGYRVWYAAWTTTGPVWNVYRTWIGPQFAPKATAYGSYSPAALTAGSSNTTAIVFPAGRFSVPPHVNVTTNSSRLSVSATSITKDGASVIVSNWSPASASPITVTWEAKEQ